MWQMGGFGPVLGRAHHFLGLKNPVDSGKAGALPGRNTAAIRRAGPAIEFVGGALSVADFAVLGWAWRHERHRIDLAEFLRVHS